MNQEICYYASWTGRHWIVRFDHDGFSQQFETRDEALAAARRAAQLRFEVLGRPSCVKIEEPDGHVVDDVAFSS